MIVALIVLIFITLTTGSPVFYEKIEDHVPNVRLADLRIKGETMLDLVENEGYTIEDHYLTTIDGYILNLHRIPHGKTTKRNGKVVLLQHGILGASSDWVMLGPQKALGYILADEGYDVWLGNSRGNTYSRNHTFLDPDRDYEFWQFSWHEMGVFDLPETVDYVLNKTGNDSVYYCAHSQGNAILYVMNSLMPEYNTKIKVAVGLAPVGFVGHVKNSLLKIFSVLQQPLAIIFSIFSPGEFLPRRSFVKSLSNKFCSEDSLFQPVCSNILFLICGYSPYQLNRTLLPELLSHTPAGASVKQFLHFSQEIISGYFRQYDYGIIKNLQKYGSVSPPDYRLDKVTTPVYVFHSAGDVLSTEKDLVNLCSKLADCKGNFLVSETLFNHMDFCYGINASNLVYEKVVSIFSRY